MGAAKYKDMMKSMPTKDSAVVAASTSYETNAVAKAIDATMGKVMLTHDPVKGLAWSARTIAFVIKDKALFDKLAVGTQVLIGFKKDRG